MTDHVSTTRNIGRYQVVTDLSQEEKLEAVQGRSLYYTYSCPNPRGATGDWTPTDRVMWIDHRGHWLQK